MPGSLGWMGVDVFQPPIGATRGPSACRGGRPMCRHNRIQKNGAVL